MADEIKNYVIVHKDDLRTALFWMNFAIGHWKHSQSAEEPMDGNTIATYGRLVDQYERTHDRLRKIWEASNQPPAHDATPRPEPSNGESA